MKRGKESVCNGFGLLFPFHKKRATFEKDVHMYMKTQA